MTRSSQFLTVAIATDRDAGELALLRTAVAEHLTRLHGIGHWSAPVTERGELRSIKTSRILIARDDETRIIGTLRLATKKPWAIDKAYFSTVPCPLYLTDMAVAPLFQHQGVGRRLIEAAKKVAAEWPADAVRLDAYNNAAGAGPFYAKCGFHEVGRVEYRGVPLIYFELLIRRAADAPPVDDVRTRE